MFQFLSAWYKRKFSDPESITLFLLLIISFTVIYFVGHIMVPVLVAIVIAYLLDWPTVKLTNTGMSRNVASSLVLLLFIGFSVAVMVGLVPIFWQQGSNLLSEAPVMLQQAKDYLQLLPEKYPKLISAQQVDLIMSNVDGGLIEIGQLALSVSFSTLRDLVALLIYLILVPLMIFFMLKDKEELVNSFKSLLPSTRRLITQVSSEMDIQIMNYIRGKLIELVIVGVATWLVLAMLDMRYAALIGLMVGVSVLVPYIGAAVVTIPVVFIGLTQWGATPDFWYAMIAYGIVQALDGNVLVPLLFSEAVDLHPVYIIIAVLFFGGLWGFWGVFFAIPLAALVKAVVSAWSSAQAPDVEQS